MSGGRGKRGARCVVEVTALGYDDDGRYCVDDTFAVSAAFWAGNILCQAGAAEWCVLAENATTSMPVFGAYDLMNSRPGEPAQLKSLADTRR